MTPRAASAAFKSARLAYQRFGSSTLGLVQRQRERVLVENAGIRPRARRYPRRPSGSRPRVLPVRFGVVNRGSRVRARLVVEAHHAETRRRCLCTAGRRPPRSRAPPARARLRGTRTPWQQRRRCLLEAHHRAVRLDDHRGLSASLSASADTRTRPAAPRHLRGADEDGARLRAHRRGHRLGQVLFQHRLAAFLVLGKRASGHQRLALMATGAFAQDRGTPRGGAGKGPAQAGGRGHAPRAVFRRGEGDAGRRVGCEYQLTLKGTRKDRDGRQTGRHRRQLQVGIGGAAAMVFAFLEDGPRWRCTSVADASHYEGIDVESGVVRSTMSQARLEPGSPRRTAPARPSASFAGSSREPTISCPIPVRGEDSFALALHETECAGADSLVDLADLKAALAARGVVAPSEAGLKHSSVRARG